MTADLRADRFRDSRPNQIAYACPLSDRETFRQHRDSRPPYKIDGEQQ